MKKIVEDAAEPAKQPEPQPTELVQEAVKAPKRRAAKKPKSET